VRPVHLVVLYGTDGLDLTADASQCLRVSSALEAGTVSSCLLDSCLTPTAHGVPPGMG
jgi:hypothetical protein